MEQDSIAWKTPFAQEGLKCGIPSGHGSAYGRRRGHAGEQSCGIYPQKGRRKNKRKAGRLSECPAAKACGRQGGCQEVAERLSESGRKARRMWQKDAGGRVVFLSGIDGGRENRRGSKGGQRCREGVKKCRPIAKKYRKDAPKCREGIGKQREEGQMPAGEGRERHGDGLEGACGTCGTGTARRNCLKNPERND